MEEECQELMDYLGEMGARRVTLEMEIMPPFKDLTYQVFGRLFVICPTEVKSGRWYWWCHCDCGDFVEVAGDALKNGNTRSCGCLRRELMREVMQKLSYIHGDKDNKNSPYETWHAMRQRCSNPKTYSYRTYGKRGIKVCDEWQDYVTFKTWAIMHGWHKGLTIERIDNDGNYCPDNCEWITKSENSYRRNHTRK